MKYKAQPPSIGLALVQQGDRALLKKEGYSKDGVLNGWTENVEDTCQCGTGLLIHLRTGGATTI